MNIRLIAVLGFSSLFNSVVAQFGLNKKNTGLNNANEKVVKQQQQDGGGFGMSDWQEMMKDPEMAAAIEMFANMSPDEMQETMEEMMGMFGDDPETASAIQEVMKEVQNMDAEQLEGAMQDMMAEEEMVGAMNGVLEQIANADSSMLDSILAKKDMILESVIESGQITAEDAARFKNDPAAWESELKGIWTELRKQAA